MLAVFLAPLYVALCAYVLFRLLTACGELLPPIRKKRFMIPVCILYGILMFAPLIGFLLPTGTAIRRLFWRIGNYWFGIVLYALLIIVLVRLISLLLRRVFHVLPADLFHRFRPRLAITCVTAGLITLVCGYGIINAHIIRVRHYDVAVDKSVSQTDSLNVVLVADLHIGYNIGVPHIRQMVEKINAQQPDIVCIAGDIYDNDFDAFDDPQALAEALSGIRSTYGTYACWGNHDVNQKILGGFTFDDDTVPEHDSRMTQFLKDSGIRLLADEAVPVADKFYVVGRVDGEKPATAGNLRRSPAALTAPLDKSMPIIVLYHEPDEIAETAAAGADLMLAGHTHDGQLFPANLITAVKWENACGYLQSGNMHQITTSGVGVWGPFMRVCTASEIVQITVRFAA